MRRLSLVVVLCLFCAVQANCTEKEAQWQRNTFGTLVQARFELQCPKCETHVVVSGTEITIHVPQISAQQFQQESAASEGSGYFDAYRRYGFTKYVLTNDRDLLCTREIDVVLAGSQGSPASMASAAVSTAQLFGFAQGMTSEQIATLIGPGAIKHYRGDVMTVATAPKPDLLFSEYRLVISPSEGLVKVFAVGNSVETEDTGAELRANFHEVVNHISRLYGAPAHTFDFCSDDIECESPAFWMIGLRNQNRTLAAAWTSPPIIVAAEAVGTNSGHVALSMEFPNFGHYAAERKAGNPGTF